jgi:NAD-dependent dihydropyrimidine dehydrogenase PreA subunit
MAYKIDPGKCSNCGDCEAECAVEAIKEKDGKRVINPNECIDCGACEPVCPESAISPE